MRIVSTAIALLLTAPLGAGQRDRAGRPRARRRVGPRRHRHAIQPVPLEAITSSAGCRAGAAAGGIIGHQFGGGSGRDVATVIGAPAAVCRERDSEPVCRPPGGQHIFVRLDNGETIAVTEPADRRWASGTACASRDAARTRASSESDGRARGQRARGRSPSQQPHPESSSASLPIGRPTTTSPRSCDETYASPLPRSGDTHQPPCLLPSP